MSVNDSDVDDKELRDKHACAEVIQAWLYNRGYPNEPAEYQSSQCHDGGTLDLRPQQSRFP